MTRRLPQVEFAVLGVFAPLRDLGVFARNGFASLFSRRDARDSQRRKDMLLRGSVPLCLRVRSSSDASHTESPSHRDAEPECWRDPSYGFAKSAGSTSTFTCASEIVISRNFAPFRNCTDMCATFNPLTSRQSDTSTSTAPCDVV